MKKTLVPFSETHQFSGLIDEYLEQSPELRPFYKYVPDADVFPTVISERRKFPLDRGVLKTSLLKQYESVFRQGANGVDNVKNNILQLENENCFTVTTGHQLNIFTGPLFSIYKILTTIRLAKELSVKHPGFSFVPVFWMASEDHDFEEIRHVNLYGKRISWDRPSGGAVGRMDLNGMETVISDVKSMLGEGADISFFEKAYLESANLAAATRTIVHHLFGKYGLVILDGDDADLKQLFIPEMKDDLIRHTAFHSVTATSQKLSAIHKIQVQPREINLFYLGENSRNRIEKVDVNSYKVLNSNLHFSKDQILKELESHPENFSPNVVLRPMYQEKILPNLAYIGGPGELNYWLQFKDAFDASGISYPVFIIRNCIMLLQNSQFDKVQKLGINIQELFLSTDYLVLKVLEKSSAVHTGTETIASVINKEFEKLIHDWQQLDPSLRSSIEGEKQKMLNGMAGLEEKARRALKRKNETVVSQVKNAKEKLFPGSGLQERYENILNYYFQSESDFIDDLFDEINPFEKSFIVLSDF